MSIKFEGVSYNDAWIKGLSKEGFIKAVDLPKDKASELYDLVVPPQIKKLERKPKDDEHDT